MGMSDWKKTASSRLHLGKYVGWDGKKSQPADPKSFLQYRFTCLTLYRISVFAFFEYPFVNGLIVSSILPYSEEVGFVHFVELRRQSLSVCVGVTEQYPFFQMPEALGIAKK